MKRFFRNNGILLTVIAVLLTLVAVMGSVLFSGSVDPVSNAVRVITTPVRVVVNACVDRVNSLTGYLSRYDELEQQVADLQKENADLKSQIREAQDSNEENERLRSLLNLSEKHSDFTYVSCHVTELSGTGYESVLSLSKGSADGIAVQDCVIDANGYLAGVVTEVGLNWCTAATVVDLSTEIGASVSRTDSDGVLEGDFNLMHEGRARLSYIPSDVTLYVGDEILTSGAGGIYPSGLVIGEIEEILTEESGMASYAVIRPDADLASLSQVFVITDFSISD